MCLFVSLRKNDTIIFIQWNVHEVEEMGAGGCSQIPPLKGAGGCSQRTSYS